MNKDHLKMILAVIALGLLVFTVLQVTDSWDQTVKAGKAGQQLAKQARAAASEGMRLTAPYAAVRPPAPKPGVTMDQYRRVLTGMSEARVFQLLGKPDQELSRTEVAGHRGVMYMWRGNTPTGNMSVIIQDDEVTSKSQFGLR